ncbi:MAG: hypothetical protein BWY83_01880 [bacterium ADurb.Bin478]|nr:MAG: hypothetical protein BWY83_01880 [bacterium ADurb.Bin478]
MDRSYGEGRLHCLHSLMQIASPMPFARLTTGVPTELERGQDPADVADGFR